MPPPDDRDTPPDTMIALTNAVFELHAEFRGLRDEVRHVMRPVARPWYVNAAFVATPLVLVAILVALVMLHGPAALAAR